MAAWISVKRPKVGKKISSEAGNQTAQQPVPAE
jgi:hypothetical protein